MIKGGSKYEGQIQVYTEQWNDVCGDNWGVEEMNIACRQQGYLPRSTLNFPIGRLTFLLLDRFHSLK